MYNELISISMLISLTKVGKNIITNKKRSELSSLLNMLFRMACFLNTTYDVSKF
jgi:hypothetical protein